MNPATHDPKTYHSHAGTYLRTAVALTVITAAEIGVLFVEVLKPMFVPILVGMSVVKLAMVVGTFMHLSDDKNVFRLVFLAPMAMAAAMIAVLAVLVMPHFGPFGAGYVRLAVHKSPTERGVATGAGAGAAAAAPAKDLEAVFAATKDFSAGAEIWGTRCGACHRADGGGMAGLGPNMTDDCYLHGGSANAIAKVIQEGVAGKAMVSFRGQLTDEQIEQVALYARSLRGQQVPDGKACEGAPVAP